MELTNEQKASLRGLAEALIEGKIGEGFLSLSYSRNLVLSIERFDSHAEISVASGTAELQVPLAPDPNIVRLRIEDDRVGVEFSLGTVWLDITESGAGASDA